MKLTIFTTVRDDLENTLIRNVPVTSTVIEGEGGSLAIVDTGMQGNPELLERLEDAGYDPDDFRLVINTHLHPDHAGGNRLFPNARILVSRRELMGEQALARALQTSQDPAAALRRLGRRVTTREEPLARELKRLVDAYPVDSLVGDPEQVEYFEDEPPLPEGIRVVPVPGHSPGSQVVLLQHAGKCAVVAGDALFHRDLWRSTAAGCLHADLELFMRGARWLASLDDLIIPGHDRPFSGRSKEYLRSDTITI